MVCHIFVEKNNSSDGNGEEAETVSSEQATDSGKTKQGNNCQCGVVWCDVVWCGIVWYIESSEIFQPLSYMESALVRNVGTILCFEFLSN